LENQYENLKHCNHKKTEPTLREFKVYLPFLKRERAVNVILQTFLTVDHVQHELS
jgi:hypothetical protein